MSRLSPLSPDPVPEPEAKPRAAPEPDVGPKLRLSPLRVTMGWRRCGEGKTEGEGEGLGEEEGEGPWSGFGQGSVYKLCARQLRKGAVRLNFAFALNFRFSFALGWLRKDWRK